MELIPFLFFAFIAFQIFKGFTKTASKSGGTAKAMMQQLHKEIQKAEKLQGETTDNQRYRNKSPTQRGRDSLQSKGQSPWGENGAVSPGARVAKRYLQKERAARKASHKTPEQHGRRGRNMDQNRHRTHDWGQRGDAGILSGKNIIILLVIGGVVLFVLSKIPAA